MQQLSRTDKVRVKRKKKCKDGLVILRYAVDPFRLFNTLYRFFRMML